MISGEQKKKKIFVIVGPTAVGKTAAGIALAQNIHGEIISCDAMQVYRDVSIASNTPDGEELKKVTHHLIGIISVDQKFNAAAFRVLAQKKIDEIFLKGKVPIIVGGTGMYLKGLLDGIFEEKGSFEQIRMDIEKEIENNGSEGLYRDLQKADPDAAAKIHPNDARRIVRALEVFRATGRPISYLQKTAEGIWGKYDIFLIGLTMDRKHLYHRIEKRVDTMFDAGLVDEIRGLQMKTLSRTARAIIGVKEVGAYLSGEASLHQAKEEMKKNTRRLAKRQLTWFRAEKRMRWLEIADDESAEEIAARILQSIHGDQ